MKSSEFLSMGGNVTEAFATELVGWKPSSKNKLGWLLVPNFAHVDKRGVHLGSLQVLNVLAVDPGVSPSSLYADRQLGIRPPGPRSAPRRRS